VNKDQNGKPQAIALTDDDYEELASQEQIYLDNVEENLRVFLEELPQHAVEQRHAANADAPPLSDEIIARMYRWFAIT
jgi:hypothetical protein